MKAIKSAGGAVLVSVLIIVALVLSATSAKAASSSRPHQHTTATTTQAASSGQRHRHTTPTTTTQVTSIRQSQAITSATSVSMVDDYPIQWKNAPRHAFVDTWKYYSRYCTSWVAWALHSRNGFEMPHAIGNATNWGPWAKSHGYVVNMNPRPGSVAWWTSPQGFGHVAWVASVNADGTVTLLEYNYSHKGMFDTRIIPQRGVDGYIHFDDLKTFVLAA